MANFTHSPFQKEKKIKTGVCISFKLRLTDLQIKFMLTRTVICVSAKADRELDFHTHSKSYRRSEKDLLYTSGNSSHYSTCIWVPTRIWVKNLKNTPGLLLITKSSYFMPKRNTTR